MMWLHFFILDVIKEIQGFRAREVGRSFWEVLAEFYQDDDSC